MFKKYLNSQTGFTLVEIVAVMGVLAVTSAILIVNNKLNDLQLSLNTDIAGISSAVSRAKALTLQGVGADKGICGHGVSFGQGLNNAPDTYTVNSYTDCVYWLEKEPLAGQGGVSNLSSGLRILNLTTGEDSQFIKDIIFYSSDAKTKLFNFSGQSICMEMGCDVKSSAGIIVINTESVPTSFATLKIATTGQVTSKPGAYVNVENFDTSSEMILSQNDDGTFDYTGDAESKIIAEAGSGEEGGTTFKEDTCIPNCFCALSLPSGGTCSNGCGGICQAGGSECANPADCPPPACLLPTDCNAPNNTCVDLDSCGAHCAVCDVSNNFFCNTVTKSCEACAVCPVDANGDTCGGCFGNCKGCDGSGAGYTCTNENNVWACRIAIVQTLKLETVFPPVGYK